MESLEEVFKDMLDGNSDKLYVNADVDVQVNKEEQLQMNIDELTEAAELTKEEFAAKCKKQAMDKLGEYEDLENKKFILAGDLAKAQQELEMLFSKVRAANIDLINKINDLTNELELTEKKQGIVKDELLPLQQDLYLADNSEKTLVYNKIQSTFVAATEKNQFDLKKFREEQETFWKDNLEILKPYSKITDVSAYLKITVKK